MGGKMSRDKGKGGELEVRDLFRTALQGLMPDVTVIRRNHQQAEIGGADLVGVPYLSVEVKRVKQIVWGKGLMDWWEQCTVQAEEDGKYPCLVFRQDHGKWLVMYYTYPTQKEAGAQAYPGIFLWNTFETFLKIGFQWRGPCW